MSKPLLAATALFLLSASQCPNSNSSSVAMYGPFHVKSISDIVIAPLDCDVDPNEPATASISMRAIGAHVCTSEDSCGGDHLKLFEYELEIPHVFSESDDPARPEFYSCGGDIEGTIVGTPLDDGNEITIGSIGVPEGEDTGCALLDTTQLEFVTNPRVRISVNNQGVLLNHEDYAPALVTAEQAFSCE